MKKILISLACFATFGTEAQNWKWVRGADTSLVPGTYGTKGVAAPGNDPGGRHGCATWVDKSGNLWIFGGEGTTSNWFNDLWKYDKASNQWTWMRGANTVNSTGSYGTMGVASALNDPAAREFPTAWTDTSGIFWMFGGDAYDPVSGGALSTGDLWKYDPSINQWTWVKGFNTFDQYGVYNTMGSPSPSSLPGCRNGATPWVDNNNRLWMFGGRGWGATGSFGYLSDLWRYEPATNEWTWVKGSNAVTQPGAYGTMSVTSSSNYPGGRAFSGIWHLPNDNVYLFGGVGHSSNTLQGYLGDLWKYEPSTNNWTWMSGFNVNNQNGNYDTYGQPSPAVKPGARYSAASWMDALGKLWLFGGFGYPGQGSPANLSDLLRYDTGTGLWTMIKGDTTINRPGIYGTMGTAAPANKPGGRHYNSWWKGTGNKLWLFGGLGRDKDSTKLDNMNDLWVFDAPCNPDSASTSAAMVCSGSTTTLSMLSPDNSPVSWYSTPTSTAVMSTGSVYVTPPLNTSSLTTMTFYASAATCSAGLKAPVTVTVAPLPQITFPNSPTVACAGQVITLNVTGASTYTWNTASNSSAVTLTATVPGHTMIVIGTNAQGCENSSTHAVTVTPNPTVHASPSRSIECWDIPVTFSATGAQSYSWSSGQTVPSFTVNFLPIGTHTISVKGTDANGCSSSFSFIFTSSSCVGIRGNSLNAVRLYPNPAAAAFHIEAEGSGQEMVVTDVQGRIMGRSALHSGDNLIDLSLDKGVYLVKVLQAGGGELHTRLIVQ